METRTIKKLGAVAVVAAVTVVAMACSSGGNATTTPERDGGAVTTQPSTGASVPIVANGSGAAIAADRSVPSASYVGDYSTTYSYPYQAGSFSTGIVVSGIGVQSVAADMGIVYLGVEARAKTVSDAREAAAQAMTNVRNALKALGVADKDIVTTSFNIYPETVWVEVKDEVGTHGKPEIIGYVVNNSVEVKVRKLDDIGRVVDEAADKGGDLIRINSIAFTLSDPNTQAQALRELAAKDAKAKAEIYARAMGVTLGQLVFLSEVSSSAPVVQKDALYARAEAAGAPMTPSPISGGDVELSTTITAVFAIGQ